MRFVSVIDRPGKLAPESTAPPQPLRPERESAEVGAFDETGPTLPGTTWKDRRKSADHSASKATTLRDASFSPSTFFNPDATFSVAAKPDNRQTLGALTRSETSCRKIQVEKLDTRQTLAAWITGGGLFVIGLAPFFTWIKFGTGGVTGLTGDGKVLLAVTMLTAAAYAVAIIKRRWLTAVLLSVQAFGTIVTFWMGGLIWRVGSILETSNAGDNPFAVLFATQISPGAGLYLGLIGGFTVAASAGFLAIHLLLKMHKLNLFFTSQGSACVIGMLLLFFIIPASPPMNSSSTVNDGGTSTTTRTEWKKKYEVTDAQWAEMVANFEFRKYPESVNTLDWWKEANDKTPAQLNKLFPPPRQREWYRAEWADDYSASRELNHVDIGNKPTRYWLTLKVRVLTEPDTPITALFGKMAFVKDGNVIYEVAVAEKPDVSFTDRCLTWITVTPYDDKNQTHRTLRYAKDDELVPVFTVSKVVFADGTEKTFD